MKDKEETKETIQIGKIYVAKNTKHYAVKPMQVIDFNFGGHIGVAKSVKCEFNGDAKDIRHYVEAKFLTDYELRTEEPKG